MSHSASASTFCLGADLARLELPVLFEELLRRLPRFALVPGHQPEFAPGYFTRTLKALWVGQPSPLTYRRCRASAQASPSGRA
jgi:hypothetical protein